MNRKIFITLVMLGIVLFLFGSEKFVIRIDNPNKDAVNFFYNNGYDIASYNPEQYLDLVVDNKTYQSIILMGYNAHITQTEQDLKSNLSSKPLSGYRSYDDMLSELQQIEAEHPDICKLYDIGDSWGKIYSEQGYSEYDNFAHDIWVMKISDNVDVEEDEPNILYDGEHHAREPISMEMVMKIIHHIVDNYGTDTQITNDVNTKQIWCLPLLNPNGHKLVWDQTDVWWRKNIRDNNENHHIYSYNDADGNDGVDPNRNYGFQWGSTGTSDDWQSEVYHGPNAFSEPNIQAVRDLVLSHNFVTSISYHSYSELVLFPLGYANNTVSPDHDALQDLAVAMANTIPKLNGGYYDPEESWQLYPCMGTSDDYYYGARGIFAYTIELGVEFIPQASTMNQIVNNNVQAAMILLDRVDNRVLTGHITDATTQQPISATIYVNGVDNTGVEVDPRTSDETFGRYYRPLLPGNYDVTFSKYGYESQTVNVNIDENSQTIRDIALQPITNYVTFSGEIKSSADFSPLENVQMSFLNTPLDNIYTNESGYFNFGQVIPGTYTLQIQKDGYTPIQAEIILADDMEMPFFLTSITGESFENGIPTDWNSHIITNQWFITGANAYEGSQSLRSNPVTDNHSAIFKYQTDNLPNDDIVSFYYDVSSEQGYDFLYFYIDNTIMAQWSGETGWQYASFTVPSGTHNLSWVYSKDQAVSEGSDCAWIDLVNIPQVNENPEMLVYPQTINIELSQNSTLDSLFSIYNNSASVISGITIDSDSEWLTIPQQYQTAFNLPPFNGKYVNYTISTQNEGEYDATIEVTFNNQEIQIPVHLTVNSTINHDNQITGTTYLKAPYPNPFYKSSAKSNVTLNYQIAKDSKTILTVYNLKGQLVKKFVNGYQKAGKYSILWNMKDKNNRTVASGIYFFKLKTEDKKIIKKMIIIK